MADVDVGRKDRPEIPNKNEGRERERRHNLDPAVWAAIIGGVVTVIAALVGAMARCNTRRSGHGR
jgi:hypothetical protein